MARNATVIPLSAARSGAALPAGAEAGRLSDIIGSIYEGAIQPRPWQSALHELLAALDALHVTLILRPPSAETGGYMVNTDTVSEPATEAYRSHFFALDPFVDLPSDEVAIADDLLGRRWLETALYRDFLRPLDVRHVLGADLRIAGGAEVRLRVVRRHEAAPFGDTERQLCRLLLPHLRRSVQMHDTINRLERERALYAGTLSGLHLGILTLAADGRVRWANAEARRVLAERDGIALAGGGLALANNTQNRLFKQMLQRARSGGGGGAPGEVLAVSRPSGRAPLGLVIPPRSLHGPATITVVLRDPESGGITQAREIAGRLFGLTPSEAGLALHLADGYSVEEAAEALGLTRNTARTYLRFIFAKAGVTRQADLVRLLLNSVLPLATGPAEDDAREQTAPRLLVARPPGSRS